MSDYLTRVLPFFPKAFITDYNELVLEPKNNIYFLLENVKSDLDFECKMLEWLVRPAYKGTSKYWQDYIRRGLNSYFKMNWGPDTLQEIYTYLGGGINRELCQKFITSGFNMEVIKQHVRNRKAACKPIS